MIKLRNKQQGAETLELAVIFPLFWILLLFVFEIARALYVYNTLVEATRRGARMAVVCPRDYLDPNDELQEGFEEIVKNVAVYDELDGDGKSSLVYSLEDIHFDLTYYTLEGVEVDDETVDSQPIDENDKSFELLKELKFAEVKLNGTYQFQSILSFVIPITVPEFKTIEYAESKGAIPNYTGEPEVAPDCNF